ncbi:prolipoprotein diacylglyceryl transferase [Arcanobacterium bovis]|uniref:Phosphatidylglycerol--prolipoprotein diacylglyceryl transferase n=1 Tax=Arcanobacterium bovis TaxID=2529275 RepID=A0A4Q9V3A7_9ACTO|nr:prolipoprotein diacylglyceryl transferase [Arcanobacterium bovis]TBW22962.1 prolipoprotein diacylglyceryl transferase [Arcanobacterium bovis]
MFASIPSPPVNVWYLGPLPIRAYAFAIIIGIIVAVYILEKRYTKKGGPSEISIDVAVWAVIFGIIGARLYHIFTTPQPYFGENGDLTKIFRIWEGGLGIWGAVAAGGLGIYIALHRRGLRFAPFADALAPGLLVAQAIGRFGNWFNQELYGRPTDLPWGLEISPEHIVGGYPAGTTFHPTFLYEALWCLSAALVLILLERGKNLRGGQVIVLYVAFYTLGRVWIENLRIDEAEIIAGLRLNVWTSIFVFLGAIVVYVFVTKNLRANPQVDDIYLQAPAEAKADNNEVDRTAEA